MDCEQLDIIVMDILYGEADEQLSIEAKQHVEQCEQCAAKLVGLQSIRRTAAIPLVEAPTGFEPILLKAAQQFQREVPEHRRIMRWISWAGARAMAPQVAMSVLLVLMICFGLAFLRLRPSSDQMDVVRVTEQGVPDRAGTEPGPTHDPALLLSADPDGMNSPKDARRWFSSDNGNTRPSGAQPKPSAARVEDTVSRGASPPPVGDQGSDGQHSAQREANGPDASSPASPASPASASSGLYAFAEPPIDHFVEAMALYKARNYASAFRVFDSVAAAGGANAPLAALYAAKSVRASSGCVPAISRFEAVAVRFSGSGAALEAKWEAAACARINGDLVRARIHYSELARIEGQRERAEAELARISSAKTSSGSSAAPSASTSPRSDNPYDTPADN